MKTLPEILEEFEIIDTSHLYHHEHDVDELIKAIAKELMGCLPEKRYTKTVIPGVGAEATDEEYIFNQAIDEVRARLTAFIGKEK